MKEIRNQTIDSIEDREILDVLDDLAHMIFVPMNHYVGKDYTVFAMLQDVMNRPSKSISEKFVVSGSSLLKKMDRLEGHAFFVVCKELKNGVSLEEFGNEKMLTFLKRHFASLRPKGAKKSPQSSTSLIRQRRSNDRGSWHTDPR